MASRPITYQADVENPAPHGFAASIARKLMGFARAPKAHGIWHDIQVLESLARKDTYAAAQAWSLSPWFNGVAGRTARAIARNCASGAIRAS